jgi:hypothetical protein
MRFLLSLLAGIGLAMPASADVIWGDEGGCARLAGQAPQTDMVFLLRPDRIERWESSCMISNTTRLPGNAQRIEVTCSGEGTTWTDAYILGAERADGTVPVRIDDFPDPITYIRPCQ